jgi:4-amino-4-deoxy-L-arabinose transferase-like glycosyltransferase
MVDGLAVLLSFLSLYAFVCWEEAATGGGGYWALMVAAGVLSTLIKNPVFLPICLAMASHVAVRRGWRSLLRPGLISFGAVIVAAVLGFKLYSNRVNGVGSFWARGEAEANFGLLREGLQLENWQGILHSLGFLTLNPWTGTLAIFGALAYLRRGNPRYRGLFLGLLLGMVVTLLVFFSRNRPHSYYQLPFAFALCFFGGYGLHRMVVQIRAAWPRPGRTVAALAIVGAAAVTWAYSRVGYEELTAPTVDEIAARGEAIREWTDPTDFVIYLVDSEPEDWNPSYLYFAKRDGYNIPRSDFSAATLMSVYRSYNRRYRGVFVACPARPRILSLRLEGWGLPLAAAGPSGRLYRMQAPPPPGAP